MDLAIGAKAPTPLIMTSLSEPVLFGLGRRSSVRALGAIAVVCVALLACKRNQKAASLDGVMEFEGKRFAPKRCDFSDSRPPHSIFFKDGDERTIEIELAAGRIAKAFLHDGTVPKVQIGTDCGSASAARGPDGYVKGVIIANCGVGPRLKMHASYGNCFPSTGLVPSRGDTGTASP